MEGKPDGFDWDHDKYERNLREHRIDFRDASEIFRGPYLLLRASSRGGEHRLMAIGLLGAREVTVRIHNARRQTPTHFDQTSTDR